MLLVCCFCDKVCDDTMDQTHWQDLRTDTGFRQVQREHNVLSYTCCHHCFQRDPRATAFRTRQSQPTVSVIRARTRARRTIAAYPSTPN